MRPVWLGLVAVVASGCGDADAPKGKTEAASAVHAHPPAPHGGEILSLRGDEYHLEMIHDHSGGNVTVYVLASDAKTPVAVEAPVVNLVTKDGPVQITLTPIAPRADGKADGWRGSHEGLKADPWDGRIRVRIGDKMFQSPLEGPAHTHD
jgi:hypothetical protein